MKEPRQGEGSRPGTASDSIPSLQHQHGMPRLGDGYSGRQSVGPRADYKCIVTAGRRISMTLGQRSTPVRSYIDCLDLGLGAPVGLRPSDRLEMLGYGHHTMMRATMAPIPAAISPTETSLRFLETCPSQCRPPKRASISPRSIRAIPIRDSPIFGSMTAIGVTAAIARTAAIPCGNGALSLCQTYKALVGNTHVLNLIGDSPAY